MKIINNDSITMIIRIILVILILIIIIIIIVAIIIIRITIMGKKTKIGQRKHIIVDIE